MDNAPLHTVKKKYGGGVGEKVGFAWIFSYETLASDPGAANDAQCVVRGVAARQRR